MNFQKKAGLALAMAAIFTTGGAGAALADNITEIGPDGKLTAAVNLVGKGPANLNTDILTVTTSGEATIDINGKSLAVDGLALKGKADVTDLTIDGAATLAGTGDSLITSNGKVVDTVTVDGALTLGTTDGKTATAGGSLKNLTVTSGNVAVRGGEFTVGGNLNLSGATNGITVGDAGDTVGVALNVGALDLTGKSLFVDPSYATSPGAVSIDHFYDVAGTAGDRINGYLIAGQNSTITVGTASNAWMSGVLEDIRKTTANDTRQHWFGRKSATDTTLDITAGFGIIGSQNLLSSSGGIEVDGTLTALANKNIDAANKVIFTASSLLAVDLTGVSDTGANSVLFSHDGTDQVAITSVAIGGPNDIATTAVNDRIASIYLDNAHVGKYTVLEGLTSLKFGTNVAGNTLGAEMVATGATTKTDTELATAMGANWTGDNLIFSTRLLTGDWSMVDNNVAISDTDNLVLNVKRSTIGVSEIYPAASRSTADMIHNLYDDGANRSGWYTDNNNTTVEPGETDKAGLLLVSRLTNDRIVGEQDPLLAVSVIEGAAQIAVAAGAPAVAGNVITKISSLVVDHNNMLNATQPAYGNEPGKLGIWATPFYGMSDVDGLDSGKLEGGYEMNYGGAAFGIDYNINEAFRLGLALNVGGGDTDSDGNSDFQKTENDFDFFGVSLYGSYSNGAFGLTGDVGFTGVDNEINMAGGGYAGMGGFESNVDSDAFTVGLTGQYRFAASDNFNITPHLGLRYTKISVDDAAVESRGFGRALDVATEDQNLFQIPLGVEFSSDIATAGGWTITPSADLGVLFTTGDTDVESRARLTGLNDVMRNTSDVTDSAAFMGALGIKAAADNGLSLGLDYGILASGNQTDHQFSGMLRFEF